MGRLIWAAICVIIVPICFVYPAQAEETKEPVGFSVKAVQSQKQVNKKVSYFDLILAPGEEHLLEIDIFNTSDEAMEVLINANTAGTNSGGVIDYSNPGVTDDSLLYSFEELTKVESLIESIPANSVKRVGIKVKMPEEAFEGVMLGGVAIKKAEDRNDIQEESGTRIHNEYCYIIGAKIRVDNKDIEPEFRLRSVGPKLWNYHTSIAANLQNYKAAIVKGVNIEAAVYYNNGKEPVFTNTGSNLDVAPNSNFDFIIPCSGKLTPGDYRLRLTAAYGEKTWEFEQDFTITGYTASDFNNQAVNVPIRNYYKITTVCLSLILIVLIVLVLLKWKFDRRKKFV